MLFYATALVIWGLFVRWGLKNYYHRETTFLLWSVVLGIIMVVGSINFVTNYNRSDYRVRGSEVITSEDNLKFDDQHRVILKSSQGNEIIESINIRENTMNPAETKLVKENRKFKSVFFGFGPAPDVFVLYLKSEQMIDKDNLLRALHKTVEDMCESISHPEDVMATATLINEAIYNFVSHLEH